MSRTFKDAYREMILKHYELFKEHLTKGEYKEANEEALNIMYHFLDATLMLEEDGDIRDLAVLVDYLIG